MRLQFVLTEDERYRIRIMRESALRKKHGELSSSNPTSPDTVSSNAEASLFLNEEVSDSIESLRQSKLVAKQAGFNPNDTDIYKED